ncbi:hypothetical protein FRB90_007177 [Tulasnella sp. 427]|nr:hypothetical protein FRB90_007177 [Tulasnella sp. 427]
MRSEDADINELNFRGFSAQVRVGDRPLRVYKPEYDESMKTASGWIASEPEKEYHICWRKNEITEYAADGAIFLDGPRSRSRLNTLPQATGWIVETGERVKEQTERPFIFSELVTTDDDNLVDENIPTEPGTIRVEIKRTTTTVTKGAFTALQWDDAFSTRLHEKTKKAGGHITKQVSIGNERRAATPRISVTTKPFTDADKTPWVTFILRYRPEEALRAGGFMPDLASPLEEGHEGAAGDSENDDEDTAQTEAEIAALQAALQARVASLAKRKGVKLEEVEADLARKRRKIKQEEAINVELISAPGEVIDLTDL